jgi:surface protein
MKLKVSKNQNQYNYCPQTREELEDLLDQLLKERGWEADLNDIDVSNITNMSGLFFNYAYLNCDLSGWDVSNVTNMWDMFCGCKEFEGKGLENWDVSNVEDIQCMFASCEKFEGKGLENWNVSNVRNMSSMFYRCKKFNCNLSNWNVSNVTNYYDIFDKCPIKDEYKPKFKK